jgi:hypothetical protein
MEFSLVDFTWVLGVNPFCFVLSPLLVGIGWFVVKSTGKVFKSDPDFTVREGTTIVGIESCECFFWLVFGNTIWSLLSSINSYGADSEMLEDGVGEFMEFSLVDFTWALGVNLCSFGLNPFPVFIGWLVF